MSWEIIGGIATAVALVLSVYNFVTQHLAARRASPSARFEEYVPIGWMSKDRPPTPARRLVVTNYGPANAVDLVLELDGDPRIISMHEGDALRVPILHPGEDYHVQLSLAWQEMYPAWVDLAWSDQRRARQHRRVWVSMRQVP